VTVPQIFHCSFNTISRVSIFGSVFLVAGVGWAAYVFYRSPYVTNAHIAYVQPVPFSHAHHVADLGIDCRYCHTSVEDAAFAGMPPTKTCMNCHQEIWFGSAMLEPVRESYRTNQSIPWQRVHSLPQFVYFDHSIHIHKGVGCVSCHGRVDEMPLLYQENTLLMEWCLECHRQPERHVRPKKQVFSMTWKPSDEGHDQNTLGSELVKKYHIRDARTLTSCSTCHR
jgi:hypothetical protein